MHALERLLVTLATLQVRRPFLVVLVALCSIAPSAWLAAGLEVRTGFGELLPDSSPAVVEHRKVSTRIASQSTLAVTAQGEDTDVLKRFLVEITPKLRELPNEWVSSVDNGPREATQFFEKHKHLYADLADVEQLHRDVIERYDWEVGRELDLNLDDEPPPAFDPKAISARLERKLTEAKKSAPGTDGYYLGEGGKFAVIMLRTPLGSTDQRAFEMQERIAKIVEAADYTKADPSFRYGFAGSLVTGAEQYRAVTRDLTEVGAIGFVLVLLVVYLFFLRFRVLAVMGVSISLGCLWCFAFAELTVGHLNAATSFLISIVAGNGINAMVVYMARYLEARRSESLGVPEAVQAATLGTYQGTLAAAAVSVAAYGALMLTEFRGFRHFGVIGAAGMMLCWVATYGVLPAFLVLCERWRPLAGSRDFRDRLAGLYGRPFVWLAKRFALPVSVVGVLLAVGSATLTLLYFTGDPMEYNLRNMRNDQLAETSAGKLGGRVNEVAGRLNQSGRAVVVDRLDQVQPLVHELERLREAAPTGKKPFGTVASIYSLLPADQDKKLELWREIVERTEKAKQKGLLAAKDLELVEEHLPKSLKPIGPADLPPLVARPFEEKDGSRGRIVYVAPASGKSLYDAHYLMLWADSFREVRLPNGDIIRGTGDPVIFSDMLQYIARDAPRVTLVSFIGTALVILLAFRGRRGGWLSLASLTLGVTSLVAVLYLTGAKLNFLNFVALPIAIGVGADYAVNVMKRRELEGEAGMERAFIETGGAVVACSMTTLCGYAALLFSINGAVRSMGFAAAVGELATQLSAMLVLPAVLYIAARRRAGRSASKPADSAAPPA